MIEIDDTPRAWDESSDGPLTEDALRARYQPKTRYRVSRFILPADDRSSGSMMVALCFCLRGHGRYIFGDRVIELSAGQAVRLPGGAYQQESDEDDVFDTVKVFELPPEFW